jgi:hypothetical protein
MKAIDVRALAQRLDDGNPYSHIINPCRQLLDAVQAFKQAIGNYNCTAQPADLTVQTLLAEMLADELEAFDKEGCPF